MIYGIGIDNFEVIRIKEQIEKESGLIQDIFSQEEIEYCNNMNHKEEHFAARFSAKEAFMKALGTGWRYGIRFADIEVCNDELGKPFLLLSGKVKEITLDKGISNMHLSMTHTKSLATAIVILEIDSVNINDLNK